MNQFRSFKGVVTLSVVSVGLFRVLGNFNAVWKRRSRLDRFISSQRNALI